MKVNQQHQFAEHAHIVMPASSVRTISLQKYRQPSPLRQRQENIQDSSNKTKNEDHKQMYQKILNKKLNKALQSQPKPHIKNPMSKKLQQLRKEVDIKQMKECTFKPTINNNDKNTRTVNQFFNDQLQYNQRKNDKIQEMRIILQNNRQKQNIFRPNAQIHKNHQVQHVQQVYQRLYQDSKNKEKCAEVEKQDSRQLTRNNSISSQKRFRGISRGNSSGQLHKDSSRKLSVASQQLRRGSLKTDHQNISSDLSAITSRKISTDLTVREVEKRKQSKQSQKSKRLDVDILHKKDQNKNEQIVIGKLMKEICVVLSKCNLPLVFSYIEMNLFLQKMNFISNHNNSRKLLYEMWNMLQGQIFQEVSALSVIKVVYAIMGCHNVQLVTQCIQDTWLKNDSFAQQQEQLCKQQGKKLSFKHNLLVLSQRDSKTLKQCYEELYVNRMKAGESQFMKEDKHFQYSFKPSISKNTAEFAEKYRNRMLQQTQRLMAENKINYFVPETGQIDHADLLMLDEKRKEALLQQKREEQQKQKRRQEDESLCNPNSQRDSNRSSSNIYRDRNQELFEMGKHDQQMRKDKSADEVQQQKWKNELTFKPSIKSKNNILQQLTSKQNYIPDYDKTIYRMQGTKRSKQTKSRPSIQKDESPLLFLNVVMQGNEGVKVPVYRYDNMTTITEKVRNMMNLTSKDDRGKLEKILKMQILPALQQMQLSGVMS